MMKFHLISCPFYISVQFTFCNLVIVGYIWKFKRLTNLISVDVMKNESESHKNYIKAAPNTLQQHVNHPSHIKREGSVEPSRQMRINRE